MKKTVFRVLAPLLALAALAGVTAYAVWNEEHAVQFNAAQYGGVESSTLLIGTHLIHLSALTDQVYEIAQKSADESGQNRLFYKSELAEGAWFDITTASSLSDITTAGTPVASDVLAGLFLTHHTKADGITYDLRSGQAVSLCNIYNPYELESLEELFPLKNQYDLLREQEPNTDKTALLRLFFETNIHNAMTDDADTSLAALQDYYKVLAENGGGAQEMNAVQAVMSAVDAARRAEVYAIADFAFSAYLSEPPVTLGDESGESAAPDAALQSAANDSYKNVGEALIKQQGLRLAQGGTTMSSVRYEASQALLSHAAARDHAACDGDIARLLALDQIENGTVTNKEQELALLESTLLPGATSRYLGALAAGETDEYRRASGENSADVLLRSLLSAGMGTCNAYRGELEAMVDAQCLRLTASGAAGFVDDRLAQTAAYYADVAQDAFQTEARATVDAHVDFLARKKRALTLASGGNELDKKLLEKADLQAEMLRQLDQNDLAGAKLTEQKIKALDEAIEAMKTEQFAAVGTLQNEREQLEQALREAQASGMQTDELRARLAALTGELSAAEAGLPGGTLGSLCAELKSDCLGLIGGGATTENLQALNDKLGTLGGLLQSDTKTVFPVLKALHSAMARERDINGSGAYDGAIASVEELILNHSTAFSDAMREEKTESDLTAIAINYFSETEKALSTGDDGAGTAENSGLTGGAGIRASPAPASFSGNERAVIEILALKQYAEQTGESGAKRAMTALANKQHTLGNPYVFPDISDFSAEYVPVPAIGAYSGMRCVWNKNAQSATLACGAGYYTFSAFSGEVKRDTSGEKTDEMPAAAKYKKDIYIPETYSLTEFGADAETVPDTSLAVLAADTFRSAAEELLTLYLGG